uniref:Piwi domain-containing protein n=1 Tax=Panagrellus redivivus TaxID=6233 RepID=A0A7E4UW35_PANRE
MLNMFFVLRGRDFLHITEILAHVIADHVGMTPIFIGTKQLVPMAPMTAYSVPKMAANMKNKIRRGPGNGDDDMEDYPDCI